MTEKRIFTINLNTSEIVCEREREIKLYLIADLTQYNLQAKLV